ncbi:sulfotransferase [Stanieria cyanosphaera PCC 7437]|uniref:Sulfotransferase n=1 Tax=Stanieria cyanosphaera (strain ATCC 29371 / PCC 7437) TaxID=111780 RepID=K9XNC8_STAC7|nr:sulfotransferase [Stanieria cyanosphaera]AFZ34043.1 sulfotransferase [Stanieria cyanosphaera PCC 7437]
MRLPNFLIIGIQKAGTTSIYNYLQEHPQIYMSPVKETNFFEKNWESLPVEERNKKGIITFDDYCQLFTDVQDEIAIGEASPNYLFHYQSSAPKIKQYLPNAKLIAILRNPVERAYSDYLMHIRDAIGSRPLSEQIKYSAHKSFIIRKGFYYEPLKFYYDQFSPEQIKVFLYEDFCKQPQEIMQEMYRYLDVDDTFCPDVSKKAQVAKVPKNQTINNLLQRQNPLRTLVANSLKIIVPLETRQKLRDSLVNFNSVDKKQAPLSEEDRKQLIKIYQEDILKLQDLLQKDLSMWLAL